MPHVILSEAKNPVHTGSRQRLVKEFLPFPAGLLNDAEQRIPREAEGAAN